MGVLVDYYQHNQFFAFSEKIIDLQAANNYSPERIVYRVGRQGVAGIMLSVSVATDICSGIIFLFFYFSIFLFFYFSIFLFLYFSISLFLYFSISLFLYFSQM
ncbi:MAG: hypothetical protein COA75_14090 [Cellvibrionales bacterium]|nr:MAG: hypothetical protein COA75_14090 [Cellvibrionales bacterium]